MINQIAIKKPTIVLLNLSLLLMITLSLAAQGKTMISPYIALQYFKDTYNHRILQTTLTYSVNRRELPLSGMQISFYTGASGKELLTKVETDEKGVAKFLLNDDLKLPAAKDGSWTFSAEFAGNDSIEAGTSGLVIKDVNLSMNLTVADSIKTIYLKVFTSENGREKPVAGEVVNVFVPRMFSLLPLGEVTLDDEGNGSIEFPSDLPGDSVGNVTIISKFVDHPSFGNVEKKTIEKWGVPTSYSVPASHRALWTKTPPMWMIITLSILLSGVWGHYLFALISLIRIRIDAKRKAKEE